MNTAISGSVSQDGKTLGLAHIIYDDDGIVKVRQTFCDSTGAANKELKYVNRVLRDAARDGYVIEKAYLLMVCLNRRGTDYIEKHGIGTKCVRKSFYGAISLAGEVSTGFGKEGMDRVVCQVCRNVSILASERKDDPHIIREMVGESLGVLGNLKSLKSEYKRREYIRSMVGVSGTVKVSGKAGKTVYSVIRSGPNITRTLFVTKDRELAYKTVTENNLLMRTNEGRAVSRIMRRMSSLDYNRALLTDDMVSEWGVSRTKAERLLEATGNGRFNNYYIEITRLV